jgi:acetoin utilization deacetylase AcuC-like enzyme
VSETAGDPQGASVALITVDDIAKAYDFGASHPLRPERVLLTYEHIRDLGLMDWVEEISARVASDAEITAVHAEDFVAMVQAIDAGSVDEREGLEFGLGTPDDPIFAGMHRSARSKPWCWAAFGTPSTRREAFTMPAAERHRDSASTTIRRRPSPRSWSCARIGA